jgi:hypothetical protein
MMKIIAGWGSTERNLSAIVALFLTTTSHFGCQKRKIFTFWTAHLFILERLFLDYGLFVDY